MAQDQNRFKLPSRIAGSDKLVWTEYVDLEEKYKPLDLGLGAPDFLPPDHLTRALELVSRTKDATLHQYTRSDGHPRLVQVLAKLYSEVIDRKINPETEVLVTPGAQGAMYYAILGLIEQGDEAIIIEPFYDCYEPMVRYAGGIPKFIPLRLEKKTDNVTSADFRLDPTELKNLFNVKTKLIILNTPHNPFGKIFTKSELEMIASLCKQWNVVCISDEVYEWLVYKPHKHIRIASLPGMWERTITLGSASKTFSVTGWRIGWAYGPANLMRNLQIVHENTMYCCVTPAQEALASFLEEVLSTLGQENCYFRLLAENYAKKRNYVAQILSDAGMIPIIPEAGIFLTADWSPLEGKIDLSKEVDKYGDYRFTKWMIKNVGLEGIPVTAFYSSTNKTLPESFVRYCFIKKDENLKKVGDVLRKWRASRN